MRPLAPILEDDRIWHLNRRTVARGVALGMFFGICVPFGQSLVAALFALPLTLTVTPGVRLPSPGRDITLAQPTHMVSLLGISQVAALKLGRKS